MLWFFPNREKGAKSISLKLKAFLRPKSTDLRIRSISISISSVLEKSRTVSRLPSDLRHQI